VASRGRGGGKRGSGERGARAGAETGREKAKTLGFQILPLSVGTARFSTVGLKNTVVGVVFSRLFLPPRDVDRRMQIFYLDLL